VSADGGDDTITIGNVTASVPIAVNADFGNDVVVLGAGNLATGIPANLTIDGGSGTDSISFDDSASTGNKCYTLNGTTLTTIGMPAVNFTNFEGIGLTANNFDNTIKRRTGKRAGLGETPAAVTTRSTSATASVVNLPSVVNRQRWRGHR
jgi:hypothetical protein